MARNGLTKQQVRAIRDELLAAGSYPSADAVRRALGDTGSKSTIHRYLKELAGEEAGGAIRRADTERSLQAIVAQLADTLHADAERRLQALLAERDALLRARDAELADLRGTVAALAARLETLEGEAAPARPADAPRERGTPRGGNAGGARVGKEGFGKEGFGNFGGLLSNSRCGHRDSSPFTIILAGARSEVFDLESVHPAGLLPS
ncbi:hypothetical protein GJV26_23410 [Massilia dura]|uniref:KfrA N-terminal DNA-binding domain-containing protein n=1 Tax=Pseudoduganella dura TaxID=321982 RepID=A0A6I3XLH3_9BURK|nr:DNA-binding protein [Pseudoduganella dura]MUI15380.1 hypothetical protein [Pseudoduganella dura]GGX80354.1 hypothetical protein GCM10007386_09140 [Pseudoduganella dura]